MTEMPKSLKIILIEWNKAKKDRFDTKLFDSTSKILIITKSRQFRLVLDSAESRANANNLYVSTRAEMVHLHVASRSILNTKNT